MKPEAVRGLTVCVDTPLPLVWAAFWAGLCWGFMVGCAFVVIIRDWVR